MRDNAIMKTYSTPQLAHLFGVHEQTIRRWTEEFSDYLSVMAVPGEGRARQFTDDDLPIMALVASMKATSAQYRDIHAALQNGERGEVPSESTALVPTSDRNELQVQLLSEQLQEKELELMRLRTQLESKADVEAKLQAAQEKIEQLQREIGRLEGRLDRD